MNKNQTNRKIRKNTINNQNQTLAYAMAKLRSFNNYESPRIGFLDPHKYITLKYCDVYNFTLTTGTATNQVMNLNSLFDPDRTGTGHQPYGYDQLATLYNRYRVYVTEWKITFHAESVGFYICVVPSNGALATAITNQASFTLAGESPRSVVRCQGVGANDVIIRGKSVLNDLNGTTLAEYSGDDRFQALFGASPSELLLLNIGVYDQSGSSVTVDFSVELKFHVEIHDPFMLTQS
jgi:hypothetical protein